MLHTIKGQPSPRGGGQPDAIMERLKQGKNILQK